GAAGGGVGRRGGGARPPRQSPSPTTSVRPTGASECAATPPSETPGISVAAKVLSSGRLPEGTRVPVTTLNLRGNRLALWTILPLERGDRLECVARLADSRLVRVRCTVQAAASQSGTWLVRAEGVPDDPSDPATMAP